MADRPTPPRGPLGSDAITDRPTPPRGPLGTAPAAPGPHATHDPLALAAFAAGDAPSAERERSERLVATCPECALLVADLRAIARATAVLPAPARARDFRLRPADAARLRPAGWRRLAAALGGPRLDVLRPLSVGLTTLGLAGLLVAGFSSFSLGGMASGPSLSTVGAPIPAASDGRDLGVPGAAPGAGSLAPPQGASRPPRERDTQSYVDGPESPRPAASDGTFGSAAGESPGDKSVTGIEADKTPGQAAPQSGGPSPLVVLSGSFLLAGLGLLAARRIAGRFAA